MDLFKLFGQIIINNEDAIEAIKDTSESAKQTGDAFDRVDDRAKKLSSGGFSILKGAASNLVAEGFQKICSAIGEFISDGYEYSKQIENYATSFAVMTGSEEKAVEMTQKLQEIGASTPFELPQLADTTQLLMNYGFTADEAISQMAMLGDISQGSAEKMGRIATAYGQMNSAGKVSLEDVKQMIEAGFNPLQEISESTGESMESLYQRISEGTISVDEITQSMIRSTSEGGKYFGSMDKQSQTLEGRLSTLKDTTNEAISNIIAPLLDWLAADLLPALTEAVSQVDEKFNEFTDWIEEHQGLIILLGSLIGIVTAALTAQAVVQAVQIAMNAAEVTSLGALIAAKTASAAATLAALAPYLLITAAIAAVIAIIVLCVKHWDKIKAKTIEVATAMAAKFTEIKENIEEKISSMLASITSKFQEIVTTIESKLNDAKAKVSEIWESIKQVFSDAVDVGKQLIQDIMDGIEKSWENLKEWFRDLWDGLFGNLSVNVETNGNSGGVDGSHASGLDFVPFDGYVAELHRGEMVVPASEASILRSGAANADVANILLMILDAVQEGNSKETVLKLNNREFGRAVRGVVNA